MKKYLLIIAAAVFALAACDKKPEVAPEMSLDKTEASFEAAGGAVSVVVTSNTNWTVKGATDWLSVSPDSGNGNGNVMLNATANESKSARNATVTFVCSAKNINVKVTQAGKADSTPDPEPEPEPEKKITAITSADDFAKFAAETYEAGEVVTLEADITVKEMVPELVCTLDGKGHTITLDITTDEAIVEGNTVPQNVGLFRVLSGTVKNLKTAGSITHSAEAGSGTYHIGGIIGQANETAVIDGCENGVNLLATTKCTHHMGGIVGFTTAGVNVTNCKNTGKVEMIIPDKGASNASQLGGIVGHIEGKGEVVGCTNSGQVTYEGTGTPRIAGICGYINNATEVAFKNCTNDGYILWNEGDYTASSWSYIGGITGYYGTPTDGATILYDTCINNGKIDCNVVDTKSRTRAAGIAGHCGRSSYPDGVYTYTFKNCTNNGDVTATSTTANNRIGGIIAYSEISAIIVCDGCTNAGRIVSSGKGSVGGILGMRCSEKSTFTNFTVTSKTVVEGAEGCQIGLAIGTADESLTAALTGKVAGQVVNSGQAVTVDAGNFSSFIVGSAPNVNTAGVTFAQ